MESYIDFQRVAAANTLLFRGWNVPPEEAQPPKGFSSRLCKGSGDKKS